MKILTFDENDLLRNASFLFLLLLYFINPSNNLMLILFILFTICIGFFLKSLHLGLILSYILALIFSVGKSFVVQLIDLKQLSVLKITDPFGLVSTGTISFSDVIAGFMMIVLIYGIIKGKKILNKSNILDWIVILFFLYGILTDVIGSRRIYVSLIAEKTIFESLILYFYVRFFVIDHKRLFTFFTTLICVIVIFESFITLQQFIFSAPLGKGFEAVQIIRDFGSALDEPQFFFRPTGTFSHANILGTFLSTILPFIFLCLIKQRKKLYLFTLIVGIMALLLTLSRTSWVIVVILLFYLLFILEYKMNIKLFKLISLKKTFLILLFFLPIIIYVVPRIQYSLYSLKTSGGLQIRFLQINESLGLISENPFIGVGKEMSVPASIQASPKGIFSTYPRYVHNYYVRLVVENGIPSLLLLILLIFVKIKKILFSKSMISLGIISGIFSISLTGLLHPFFNYSLLFFFIALQPDKLKVLQ